MNQPHFYSLYRIAAILQVLLHLASLLVRINCHHHYHHHLIINTDGSFGRFWWIRVNFQSILKLPRGICSYKFNKVKLLRMHGECLLQDIMTIINGGKMRRNRSRRSGIRTICGVSLLLRAEGSFSAGTGSIDRWMDGWMLDL